MDYSVEVLRRTAANAPMYEANALMWAANEIERLSAIINTPELDNFVAAVPREAEHQRQRWGVDHDAGKEPQDWFWLVGYLAGKCLRSHIDNDVDKAKHHAITAAAACLNWHRSMLGQTNMRPGIDPAHRED